jgi:hypothetical protein
MYSNKLHKTWTCSNRRRPNKLNSYHWPLSTLSRCWWYPSTGIFWSPRWHLGHQVLQHPQQQHHYVAMEDHIMEVAQAVLQVGLFVFLTSLHFNWFCCFAVVFEMSFSSTGLELLCYSSLTKVQKLLHTYTEKTDHSKQECKTSLISSSASLLFSVVNFFLYVRIRRPYRV